MFLWCPNFCFVQTRYHHSFCPGIEFFCNCIKHQITVETSRLSAPNALVIQGVRGHTPPPPPKNVWKLDPRKRRIQHLLDRTQLIHTCILLSFYQSLVTHDPEPKYKVSDKISLLLKGWEAFTLCFPLLAIFHPFPKQRACSQTS